MVNQPLGLEIFAFSFLTVNLRKRTLMFTVEMFGIRRQRMVKKVGGQIFDL